MGAMTKQKRPPKKRFSTTIPKKLHNRFIKHIKKQHYGVVYGTFSFETEKAIKQYLDSFSK